MNKKDFNHLKEYTKSMILKGNEKDYMEGYINALIDYKHINTSQADELVKIIKELI